MKPVLVACCTNAGSTAEVAAAVGEELEATGAPVDVRGIRDINDIDRYGAVVVGGPVILGAWHRDAVAFVVRQQHALRQVPVAYFVTALNLTRTRATGLGPVPVFYDPTLATPPRRTDRLSFTERHATVRQYLAPVLQQAPLASLVSVAFFAGKLDYRALSLPKRAFARLVIRKPGDFRNWPAIRAWAADMGRALRADAAWIDPVAALEHAAFALTARF